MQKLIAKLKDRFSKEKFSVGLDIGTYSLKAVKLKFLKDTVELCAVDSLPAQVDLGEALKKLSPMQNTNRVNIAISGPSTVIRYINFPKMSSEEIKKSLRFEAQKYLPFPLNDLSLDSCILKENGSDKMFLLLAAIKNDFLKQRLKLMEDAGFGVDVFDLDSVALINAFTFNYFLDDALKDKTIALLNIGASLTNLNVLEGNIPHLSRDIQIAGIKLTQKIVDLLGLDVKEAENLKLNHIEAGQAGMDKEKINKPEGGGLASDSQSQKINKAIESVVTSLASEIRVSFDYYESQGSSSVSKIFLSGGCSKAAGLKEMLASFLGIEVEYWDPLKKIKLSAGIDTQKIQDLSVQLAVAVGLALRQ